MSLVLQAYIERDGLRVDLKSIDLAKFSLLKLKPALILWSLEFGVGVFHEFLLINFVGDELMQGGNMQKNFDLATGQSSEEHRRQLASEGAELVA